MALVLQVKDKTGNQLVCDKIYVGPIERTNEHSTLPIDASDGISDGDSVDVLIEKSGYKSYAITIDNVYKNISDETNKVINVILIPEVTDTNDADFNKPYPQYFSFTDPCSFQVDYYLASNENYDTTWILGDGIVETGSKYIKQFDSPGEYTVKVRQESFDYVETNGVINKVDRWDQIWGNSVTGIVGNTVPRDVNQDLQEYLDLDTLSNTTVLEYRADLNLSVSGDTTPLVDNNAISYPRWESVKITPSWEINREGADIDEHTISYKVTNPTGGDVSLIQNEFPLSLGASEATIDVFLDILGTYKIEATINDLECNNTFVQTIEVETSNFIVVEPNIECGTFTVYNRSKDKDVSLDIGDYKNSSVEGYTDTVVIKAGGSFEFSIDTGLFIMTLSYDENELSIIESMIVSNYCKINNCISSYIQNVLCSPSSCDCHYDISEELAAMRQITLYQTYFMHLTKEFPFNAFYTGLSDSLMDNISDAQQVLDKMNEYCDRVSCIDGDCAGCKGTGTTNITSNGTSDCGCS